MKKEDLINAVVRTLYDEQMHLHTKDRGMVILYLYQLAGVKEHIHCGWNYTANLPCFICRGTPEDRIPKSVAGFPPSRESSA